ncbi:hypothetical protein L6Q79_16240, partial [bacterium]|nr:hypothetical protein [bacterium]
MKFIVKKLGNIESGEVELGKLTIICGQNNTGKTYLSYAICGFINYALREAEFNIDKSTFEKLFETGFISLDISKFESFLSHSLKQLFIQYRNQIHTVFNTDEKFFSGCELSVIFDAIVPNFEREIKAGIGLR